MALPSPNHYVLARDRPPTHYATPIGRYLKKPRKLRAKKTREIVHAPFLPVKVQRNVFRENSRLFLAPKTVEWGVCVSNRRLLCTRNVLVCCPVINCVVNVMLLFFNCTVMYLQVTWRSVHCLFLILINKRFCNLKGKIITHHIPKQFQYCCFFNFHKTVTVVRTLM